MGVLSVPGFVRSKEEKGPKSVAQGAGSAPEAEYVLQIGAGTAPGACREDVAQIRICGK